MEPSKYLNGQRDRLEEAALKYARMKLFGIYLDDNGNSCSCSQRDAETNAGYLLKDLGREAERLLQEIAASPLPPRN